MRRRPVTKYRPALEQIENKQLLSASPLTTHAATVSPHKASANQGRELGETAAWLFGFRVTNPFVNVPYTLVPPFKQVLVQKNQPVPGQVYNVLQITVKNGTSQTFTAGNGFTVRLNTDKKDVFPVLTGSEQWKPQQTIVFYILTKKYYPLPQTYGGFQLDLGGRSSTLGARAVGHFPEAQVQSGHVRQLAGRDRVRRTG